MAEEPLLKPETLRGLLDLDPSGQFLQDMVQVFHQDMGRNLEQAGQAAENGDIAEFRKACHAIKNAADCIGASQLRQYAHQLMADDSITGKQSMHIQLAILQRHYREVSDVLVRINKNNIKNKIEELTQNPY